MNEIYLHKWQLKPAAGSQKLIPKEIVFPDELEVTIPGDIYLHLLEANLIDDPFYADNELKLAWVAQCDWEYSTGFNIENNSPKDMLVCESLDTIAEIFLNGHFIGRAENMFIRYTFSIRKWLRPEKNTIKIIFRSPLKEAFKNRSDIRQLPSARHPDRVFIRKAQYSFGWDWGPSFPSTGIRKDLYLIQSQLEIDHISFETISLKNKNATVKIKPSFSDVPQRDFFVRIKLFDEEQQFEQTFYSKETEEISAVFEIKNARLWWPHNQGAPHLYDLEVSVMNHAEQQIAGYQKKVGIRTVELRLREKDSHCFRFYINGKPVFLKGANWIPADSFLTRVSRDKYKNLVQAARQANINVLRVWGGGIYEDDYFYELCDREGILIWQDFMFACATYPDDDKFLKNVKEEITQNVNRLKIHPSIIIWCGNNEIEWIWHRDKLGPVDKMQGFEFFHKIIPGWLNELDTTRPYWPSSPFGDEEDPNSEISGNRHVWDIWSFWVDYQNVTNDKSLFVTEFGFQAPAALETFKSALPPDALTPQSALFEFHNKQEEGNERLFRFLSAHLPVSTDFESFIYLTQLNQGLALKTCLEHWRSRWPETSGSIIWQINDCWPVSSWSLIDYKNRRKHAYYFTKHSFQNLLIVFSEKQDKMQVNVINDNPYDLNITLKFYGWDFHSQTGNEAKKIERTINKSQKAEVYIQDKNELHNKCLIVTAIDDKGNLLSRNFYTVAEWKHVTLPKANYSLKMISSDTFLLTSSTILFFFKAEHPEVEMKDLPEVILPGETYEIRITGGELNQQKLSEFSMKTLNNYLCEM